MKKILIGIVAVALLGFAFTVKSNNDTTSIKTKKVATTVGINFFHGTWEEALDKAKEEDKLIFLDAYASWCGPCKRMARTTFMNKSVGDFYNKNFINFKMDMEKHPQGRRLSQKFHLRAYPSLYFVNSKEEVSHKIVGGLSVSQILQLGKEALATK